jgi:hypothetical protein
LLAFSGATSSAEQKTTRFWVTDPWRVFSWNFRLIGSPKSKFANLGALSTGYTSKPHPTVTTAMSLLELWLRLRLLLPSIMVSVPRPLSFRCFGKSLDVALACERRTGALPDFCFALTPYIGTTAEATEKEYAAGLPIWSGASSSQGYRRATDSPATNHINSPSYQVPHG